ncbi:MAG TPA: hypothetical protein PKU97_24140, partial [Kofleriaceae bacterium]|nr:hypothetical protein [Kofleriaceae bacterium]
TASQSPLSTALREELSALVAGWLRAPRARKSSAAVTAAGGVLLLVAGLGQVAQAASTAELLQEARVTYERAMALPTAQISERRQQFGQAQAAFAQVVVQLPGRPELLVDWGNAALGAGDVASATLAYRRALSIDPAHPRATHNLALLRSKQAEAYRASAASATGTLFFFHTWPRSRRMLVGAIAFAAAILLLVSWRRDDAEADEAQRARVLGRARAARALALAPLAIWAAMSLSLLLEDRRLADAVVMQSVVLRAADSVSAPAALAQPVPRGAEVEVTSRRERWARVRLATGAAGWVPTSSIELVAAAR